MADSRYEIGKGMMGGPGGTYGRYSVGPRVIAEGKGMRNLSTQFGNSASTADDVEEQQRLRFGRRREPNYSGSGFWFANYPYMIGALGAGTNNNPDPNTDHDQPMSDGAASATNGDGMGGTAAGFVGGLGT